MKNLRIILIVISVVLMTVLMSHRQNEDIIYCIPQAVSLKVESEIFNVDNVSNKYVCVFDSKKDTTSLLFVKINEMDQGEQLTKIFSRSNRKLLIGKQIVPIMFYTDFIFSTIFNTLNNDSSVTSVSYNLGGYSVLFKGKFMSGRLISSGYDK